MEPPAPAPPVGPPARWADPHGWTESDGWMQSGMEDGGQPGEEAVRGTRAVRFARKRWYTRAWVVIVAVTALAGGLRFWHLSFPHGYVFDEVYYAKDGCYDAGYPYRQCDLNSPGEQTITVHPPLGREAIAMSIRLFGNRSFGWRFGSAVAGTLTVSMLAVLAYLLWGNALWAGVAGLLLAIENLNVVQSRVSMLDIFVVFWVVAGFLFLVLDRRWIDRRTAPPRHRSAQEVLLGFGPDPVVAPIVRPWRIVAGLAFGGAAATKWSGGTALVGAVILTLAWERTRRSDAGFRHPFWEALRDEAFGVFVFLFLLPVAVYVASYFRWFQQNGFDIAGWLHLQQGMAHFSLTLHSPHPYASAPWKWILMWRPVAYYYQCPAKVGSSCTKAAEILGMGHPLIFWTSVITIPYAAIAWARKRDWRAGFIVVAFAAQYLPWFLTTRTSFLFYMAPVTPFMVLAFTYAVRDLAAVPVGVQGRTLAPLSAAAVLTAVAMFVFFWPILIGQTTSWQAWHIRMWFPSWV